MKQYLPLTFIAGVTLIPLGLLANNYLNGDIINIKDYIIPSITPLVTGLVYYAQTKVKNGLDIFKVEVTHQVSKIQDSFSELKSETYDIKEKLDVVRHDIQEIKTLDQTKKEFKTLLEITSKECISLMEEDNQLKHFATLKTKYIIDYAVDFRECIDSINEDIFEIKKKQVLCLAEELKHEGYELLCDDIIDMYYVKHEKNINHFISKIEKYILSDNLHKKILFQEDCLKFIRLSLSDLDKTFLLFKKIV